MVNKLEKMQTKSLIIIYAEMAILLMFFILTIVEIILASRMNEKYTTAEDKYFLFIMNERMVQPSYLAEWKLLTDPYQACPDGYSKQRLLTLRTINNVTLTDVTDRIHRANLVKDPTGKTYYNNTFEGHKYYTFDIQKVGNESLNLLYDYVFHTLAGYSFCSMELKLDSAYKAFKAIPANQVCKDTFPEIPTSDCGVYANETYRLCMDRTLVSFANKTTISQTTLDEYFVCPYNQLQIKVIPNPAYNSSNSLSEPFIVEFKTALRNESDDPAFVDKTFFMNIQPFATIGNSFNLINPNDTYVYFDPEAIKSYTVGQPYGFTTQTSAKIFELDFTRFYNETYYPGPSYLFNNYDNLIDYYPTPLGDFDDPNKFYFPIDSKRKTKDALKTAFWSFTFPTISKTCFENIFNPQGITDIFNYFSGLAMNFYVETKSTLFAWLFAQLFVAVYCYLKIRLLLLIDKKNMKLSPADKTSENVSKYIYKALLFVVFGIIFTALQINKSSFSTILTNIGDIIKFTCFNENRTLQLIEYSRFVNTMQDANNSVYLCFWISFALEIIQILLYMAYDLTDNSPIEMENEEDDLLLKKKTN